MKFILLSKTDLSADLFFLLSAPPSLAKAFCVCVFPSRQRWFSHFFYVLFLSRLKKLSTVDLALVFVSFFFFVCVVFLCIFISFFFFVHVILLVFNCYPPFPSSFPPPPFLFFFFNLKSAHSVRLSSCFSDSPTCSRWELGSFETTKGKKKKGNKRAGCAGCWPQNVFLPYDAPPPSLKKKKTQVPHTHTQKKGIKKI